MKSIYIAVFENSIKIGVAKCPSKRVEALRLGNPNIIIAFESELVSNPFEIEALIHKSYSDYALGREWFQCCSLEKVIETVKLYVKTYGKYDEKERKFGEEILNSMSVECEKLEIELEEMRYENEELGKFLFCILGRERDNIYTNAVYKSIFGKNANQLREQHGIGKKENLRDMFSAEELKAIQSMECLVSGLIDCGWGYEKIRDFIQENSVGKIAC